MIFEKGSSGVVVTLDCVAQYPYEKRYELSQAKELSASGVPHTEDFGVQTGTFRFNFFDMSGSDFQKLFDFFTKEAKGINEEFDLTDDLGAKRTGSFLEPILDFEQNVNNLWVGGFGFEEIK